MLYMVTFTINIPPMLVYIPYMDPMEIIWEENQMFSALVDRSPSSKYSSRSTNSVRGALTKIRKPRCEPLRWP